MLHGILGLALVARGRFLALSFVLVLPMSAQAAPWIICNYTIHVQALAANTLHAVVVQVPLSNGASCLRPGAELRFKPETADYQSHLPKKLWPKLGQAVKLRYRELHGICKNDGNEKPCAISHYSILR